MSRVPARAMILAPLVIVVAASGPARAIDLGCRHGDEEQGTVASLLTQVDPLLPLAVCDPAPPPTPTPEPPEPSDPPRPRAEPTPRQEPRERAREVAAAAPSRAAIVEAPVSPVTRPAAPAITMVPSSSPTLPVSSNGPAGVWPFAMLLAGMLAGAFLGAARMRSRADRDARRTVGQALALMPDGVVVTDQRHRIRSINPAAAGLLGIEPAAALGRSPSAVIAGSAESGDRLPTWLRDRATEPRATVGTLEHGSIPVAISVARAGDGSAVIVLRDLRPARDVERMKREFLSNVGHELRTPLTSALGFARILRDRELTPEQGRTFVSAVVNACEKLDRVVDLLIDVATIEGGVVSAGADRIDVEHLIDAIAQRWQGLSDRHIISARVAGRVPVARGNASLIRHALHELVDNAVKFSPAGGMVTITARADGHGRSRVLRIEVSDQGVGIEPAAAEELFDDFTQGDGSETRRFGGLGLGLSFARRVAAMHGGRIDLRSEPGVGTTAAMELPVPAATSGGARRRSPKATARL